MLIKHSLIYLLAKAIPALVAFAALSLYTHLLQPDEYGLYTLSLTTALLINAIFMNWLPAGTLRFWSKTGYSRETFITTIATAYLRIILVLLIPLAIAVVVFWSYGLVKIVFGTFALSLALALYTITQYLLSSQILPLKYAQLTIMGSLSSLLFGGSLAYYGFGAIGILTGAALGFTLPSLLMSGKTWAKYQRDSYSPELLKKLLVYGIPIGSAFILEELTKSADRFMLAAFQGKAEAGMYAAGYDISGNSVFMLMAAINVAAYPVIIKLLENESKEAAVEYFNKYAVLLMGISIPAAVGLILVGPNLINLMIGESYQDAIIMLLPWMTTALVLAGIQAFYFDLAFQLGHYTIGIVKIGIIITLFNILLNYLLIPTMGMLGAAIATISSFAFGAVLSYLYGRKWFVIPFPRSDLTKIVIATLVMATAVWLVKDQSGWLSLLLQIGVGVVTYSLSIVALDVMALRQTLKQALVKKYST